jgi:hypothetical protein
MSMTRRIVLAVSMLALGFLGGYGVRGIRERDIGGRAGRESAPDFKPSASRLAVPAESPSAPASKATPAPVAPSVSRTEHLKFLAELGKSKVAVFRTPILDPSGKIAKPFAELFALTSSESNALQVAADKARAAMESYAIAKAQVAQADHLSVVVNIPPLEEGGEVFDNVSSEFQKVLGRDRYDVFMALEGDEFAKAFGTFGAEQRSLTVREFSTSGGSKTYVIVDQRTGVDGVISRVATRFPTENPLPENYGWMGRFQPLIGALQTSPNNVIGPFDSMNIIPSKDGNYSDRPKPK